METKVLIEKLIEDMKGYFKNNGLPAKVVVGVSGGKDSSVVAALAAKAFGPENVIGVEMPNSVQADISDSDKIIEFLGIQKYVANIGEMYNALCKICPGTSATYAAKTNSPARLRMTTLYNIAAIEKAVVLNTCNLSEDVLGYSTLFGDSAGSYAPISKLTVTEVRAIGDALGLPYELVHKAPSDGMCGSTDEDNLSKQLDIPEFTYKRLDKMIRDEDDKGNFTEEQRERIFAMYNRMKFKLDICNLPCYWPDLKNIFFD